MWTVCVFSQWERTGWRTESWEWKGDYVIPSNSLLEFLSGSPAVMITDTGFWVSIASNHGSLTLRPDTSLAEPWISHTEKDNSYYITKLCKGIKNKMKKRRRSKTQSLQIFTIQCLALFLLCLASPSYRHLARRDLILKISTFQTAWHRNKTMENRNSWLLGQFSTDYFIPHRMEELGRLI